MPFDGMRPDVAPATADHDHVLHPKIRRMAKAIARQTTKGVQLAEDLEQDAWVKILFVRSRDGVPSDFALEICRARHAMFDTIRGLRRRPTEAYGDEVDEAGSTEGDAINALDLESALLALKEKGFHIRRYIAGDSTRELAEQHGVPQGTMKARLLTARKSLHAFLGTVPDGRAQNIGRFHGIACPSGHTLRRRNSNGKTSCVVCAKERKAQHKQKQRESLNYAQPASVACT